MKKKIVHALINILSIFTIFINFFQYIPFDRTYYATFHAARLFVLYLRRSSTTLIMYAVVCCVHKWTQTHILSINWSKNNNETSSQKSKANAILFNWRLENWINHNFYDFLCVWLWQYIVLMLRLQYNLIINIIHVWIIVRVKKK